MARFKTASLTALSILAAAGAACHSSHHRDHDERVSQSEVPPAVRATIEQHLAGGKIDEIERCIEKGKVVYDVEVDSAKGDFEFAVAEDGSFLGMDTEDDEDEGDDDDDDDDHRGAAR